MCVLLFRLEGAALMVCAASGAGLHVARAEAPSSLPLSAPTPPLQASASAPQNGASQAAKDLSSQRINQAVQRQLQLARLALQGKRYEDARRNFAVAYAFSPGAEALRGIAESAHKAERYAEALVLYERLVAEFPQLPYRQEADGWIKTLRGIMADEEVDAIQLIRDHLDEAKRSFQNRQYSDAIHAYATAYALKRLPRLLFNIAQGERRARNMVEAYLMYGRLLQEEPGTQVRSEAEGYLQELRVVVSKPPLYKQPWLWGVIAGSSAAAAAIGIGVGLSQRSSQGEGTLQVTFPLLTVRR